VKAERPPHQSLEHVEQGSVVGGLTDRFEADVRPVFGDETGPRPERHRVPLAVRQDDRNEQREQKHGCCEQREYPARHSQWVAGDGESGQSAFRNGA
jgi:hypothetical protein